jgi:flagellar motility protein MotE (MotC chaperone)
MMTLDLEDSTTMAVRVLKLAFAAMLMSSAVANAEDAHGSAAPAGISADEIQQYCSNIVDPARDRRYLIQTQELQKLQAGVDERLKALEARKAEYQDWLQRRNDFLQKAEASLVDIYKNMKPDAAAPRLAAVDTNIAAAILMKLTPRQSGLILSEMAADKAAKLTGIISSASDSTTSKSPS